ncbi:hypothetical protein ACQPYK_17210 [Streptosporangium sp. CA-135522]|uniref:hypothetical protein n=1 Tax=Streptosporangium sp. CA-135522 TaxID=3240072 RepID=UPI003D8F4198
MPSPSRIDAHHHVWELARRPHHRLDTPAPAPIRADFPPAANPPVGSATADALIAGLSPSERAAVLHGTATSVYDLTLT